MPSTVARGQITIMDYNDAVSLNSYISSNQALTQIFTKDTNGYTPDWTVSSYLVLTPQLFKSGSSTDLMVAGTNVKSVAWSSSGVPIGTFTAPSTVTGGDASHIIASTAPFTLTVKSNDLSALNQKNFECTIVWTDTNTGLDITVKSAITFTKVTNAGSLITAICIAPNGSVFKNGASANLQAHCDLWRGSSIDNSNITYKWFKQTANVFAPTTSTSATTNGGSTVILTSVTNIGVGSVIVVGTEPVKTVSAVNTGTKTVTISGTFGSVQASGVTVSDPRYDVLAGANWSIINASYNYSGITNYTTNEITIPDATVVNFETFKCTITDTDGSSPTNGQTVSDIISFSDTTDPIAVDIDATSGTVLRQGVGSTTLNANLWQAGAKIDIAGTGYTYTWTRYDSTGTLDGTWGGGGSKTGKSVTITDPDVTGKATFYCTISTLS